MTSDPEWNALADAWRDEPETTETFDLPRMRRRLKRRAVIARVKIALDVAGCLMVGGFAIYSITRGTPTGVITGLGGLAFVLFGLTVALWVARAPWETRAETVDAALRSEIVQARAASRRAQSGYYISAGAVAFIVLVFMVARADRNRDDATAAIAFSLAAIAASLVWAAWTDHQHRRKLALLETMLAELTPSEEEG
ncbi:MAG: hypothetical protein ABW063_06280 [Caulobacter sp.]